MVRFLGIPHAEMDCWKLCQYFYAEVFKKELPDLYSIPPRGEKCQESIDSGKKMFVEVESPEFGDIVLMNIGGYPSHVGVYVGEDKILQTFQKQGSAIHPLSKWKKSIIGFYRWPN